MLTEICAYLKNYFDRNQAKFHGSFEIKNGTIESFNDGDMGLMEGQYFRVIGSVFCDGVWEYGKNDLPHDEVFTGSVWAMAVPQDVIDLSTEISAWIQKYGTVDSTNMSPFTSESFDGYSYSKSQRYTNNSSSPSGWQDAFGRRLMRYKKI